MNNDLIQLIMTRTSIRAFQDKPVSDETVEVLLKAAMAAPSAKNSPVVVHRHPRPCPA